jgi:hypothetical protein
MAHLSDDETVAKMGHPIVVVRLDVGHPSRSHLRTPSPTRSQSPRRSNAPPRPNTGSVTQHQLPFARGRPEITATIYPDFAFSARPRVADSHIRPKRRGQRWVWPSAESINFIVEHFRLYDGRIAKQHLASWMEDTWSKISPKFLRWM